MNESVSPPDAADCPPDGQLRAYSMANLSRASMDQVERHVYECDRCLQAIEVWDEESDVLIQGLAALPSGPDDEPAFRTLQETLLAGGHRISLVDSPTTLVQTITAQNDEVPDQIGGYQLLALIGQGATGAVFRARHVKLDRIVAIKVLNFRYVGHDPEAVTRFQQEMRAVGQLDHTHIVRATDAGEEDGRHFLVMQYVDGIDASKLLRLTGPLRVADACEIVRQAASALQFAHDHRMVHRDVKPSNLLFGFDGQVKLLDLGLVRNDDRTTQESESSQTDVPHGTADYMPPEQWTRFETVDARADIYALGCTLYKLLTGKPVYPGPRHDYVAKMEAHLSATIPPVRHHRPEVPLGLQKIVGRMLAKQPEDRYDSASEVVDRLDVYAQGARLRELGARVASISSDEVQQAVSEKTDSATETGSARRRRTRRQILAAAATVSIPLFALLWRMRTPEKPTLQLSDWRRLGPTEPTTTFRRSTSPASADRMTATKHEVGRSLHVSATDDSLFHLGQPVQGCFALRATFQCEPAFERLGLFFKYRPHKADDVVAHPFQVIELAEKGAEEYRLLWSRYCYFEQKDGTYRCQYTPWAETTVAFSPKTEPGQIELVLGRPGFPTVAWKGQVLDSSQWTRSWQARHMSRQTRDELQHAYMGRLGIFARSASASFSRLELRYFDPTETL